MHFLHSQEQEWELLQTEFQRAFPTQVKVMHELEENSRSLRLREEQSNWMLTPSVEKVEHRFLFPKKKQKPIRRLTNT
jgi:hypothetical protein